MFRPTFRQLTILDAVARCGNFSRAGAELHLSQPAVSMQVKLLEDGLGLPLFEQMGKHIHLTEAGREVLAAGRAIGRELINLENALAALRGLAGGTLTVSAASTASYFTARLMALFRHDHPDVHISLNVVNRETLLHQLADNAIDMALMGQPPDGHDVEAQPFMENPLVVIAAPVHPLAGMHDIPLARIAVEVFVAREQGSGTRSAVENYFAAQGLALKWAMEMNKNEAIKQAVEAGLGLGVVSLHTVQAELASRHLCVLDVQGFPLRRQWYLVKRQGKRLSPVAQVFSQFVLSEAARIAHSAV